MEEEPDKHRLPRRLRAHQNVGYGLVWQGDDCATQTHQGVLCHEDPRQAEGGQAEAGRAHPE